MTRLMTVFLMVATLLFSAEVAGKWKIHSESSTGHKTDAVLEVREDWGAWNAVLIVGDDKIPVKAVVVEGDRLNFEVQTPDITFNVKAVVKGEQLEGTFTATDGSKGTIAGKRL